MAERLPWLDASAAPDFPVEVIRTRTVERGTATPA
jgi:hypothetical protein